METSACPEDMIGTPACPGTSKGGRGNKGWGAPCDQSIECDVGLLCLQGDAGRTCETAPSCDATSDCPGGAVCVSGTCDVSETADDGPTGPYKKNWFGLHVGLDLAFLSGDAVCSQDSQQNDGYSCFYGDADRTQFTGPAYPAAAGKINGGTAPGTIRILASYERAFSSSIGAEARLGFAFNGGPTPTGGAAFLPIHGEARLKYWFGRNAYARKGIRPYVFLGGGMAQVDAKLLVRVGDCSAYMDQAVRDACGRGDPNAAPTSNDIVGVDAYKKLGQGFATLGGGAMYAFGASHGLVVNLNFMYMFPSSGPVLEPSLGYSLGL
jgi:hypothetical protein